MILFCKLSKNKPKIKKYVIWGQTFFYYVYFLSKLADILCLVLIINSLNLD